MVEDGQHQPAPTRPQLTPEHQQAMRQVATRIADMLDERTPGPRAQVARVVRVLGIERAQAFYEQALAVEQAGGMLLPMGAGAAPPAGCSSSSCGMASPSRSAGRSSPTQRMVSRRGCPGRPRRHRYSLSPVPHITDIPKLSGEVRTVKIRLIGRPGPITSSPTGHITTTLHSTRVPSLPKGVPAPPPTPTTYTVYIAAKQWTKVAPALLDPEDVLIVEGFPAYDPQHVGITVYTTNVTTKVLQQAQRAAQQQGI